MAARNKSLTRPESIAMSVSSVIDAISHGVNPRRTISIQVQEFAEWKSSEGDYEPQDVPVPRRGGERTAPSADHFESWKMMPSVCRRPDRRRLTPCRILTR